MFLGLWIGKEFNRSDKMTFPKNIISSDLSNFNKLSKSLFSYILNDSSSIPHALALNNNNYSGEFHGNERQMLSDQFHHHHGQQFGADSMHNEGQVGQFGVDKLMIPVDAQQQQVCFLLCLGGSVDFSVNLSLNF